jgi:hypothetical protein
MLITKKLAQEVMAFAQEHHIFLFVATNMDKFTLLNNMQRGKAGQFAASICAE